MYWSHILFVIFFVAGNACVLEPKMAPIGLTSLNTTGWSQNSEQWSNDMTFSSLTDVSLIISSWIFRPCIPSCGGDVPGDMSLGRRVPDRCVLSLHYCTGQYNNFYLRVLNVHIISEKIEKVSIEDTRHNRKGLSHETDWKMHGVDGLTLYTVTSTYVA
jgi:hypothetical protein